MEVERLWSMRAFDPSIVSLEQISASMPYFNKDDPVLYALFLQHNRNKLTDDEVLEVQKVIKIMSQYHLGLMEMNKKYMERDLNEKAHESIDDERDAQGDQRDQGDKTDDTF